MKKRIYYHHTDCGGVVYYGTYLDFLEEARSEFLENKGISIKELIKQGTPFIVSRQEVDYKFPAFYGDILDIDTRVAGISRARLEFEYEIRNQDGKLTCTAKTIMACVDNNFKPKVIPEAVRTSLS